MNTVSFSEFAVDALNFSSKGHLIFSRRQAWKDEILSYEPDTGTTHHLFFTLDKANSLVFSSEDQMALILDVGFTTWPRALIVRLMARRGRQRWYSLLTKSFSWRPNLCPLYRNPCTYGIYRPTRRA